MERPKVTENEATDAKTICPKTMATRLRTACATKLLPLLLLLALPAAVQAQFTFTTNSGAITITGYTPGVPPVGALIIPSTTNGWPVTSIGLEAFFEATHLTSLTIPNSVTSIGAFAFEDCSSLSNATIGTSVTNLGNYAFFGCSSLTSVTIPNSVTSIGEDAFSVCGLTSVAIGTNVTSIGADAFNCGRLPSVMIPASVTSIGADAFANCNYLTRVYFQGSAPTVSSNVFYGDNATVYYLSGTTGWYTPFGGVPAVSWNPQVPYNYTTNNRTITITSYIGPGGAVTIPSTINGWPVTGIGLEAFYRATQLTSVTISNSVTSIGAFAFDGCTSLTSVTIPDSVTSIGNGAFQGCTYLTSVTIGTSVTNIGMHAFDGCTSLTSVTIPDSVTSIGDYALADCINLNGVYFEGNAPSISTNGVFSVDYKATVYYLPGTTGWGPFSANTGLTPVLWNPQVQTSGASFGVRTNRFGFTITGTSNLVIVVEACTNPANQTWSPVATNTLTGGSSYFSDPQWTNYRARFYRLRSP